MESKSELVSVAEATKLSKEKIVKLKKISKKVKAINQNNIINSPCAYHY